MGSLSDVKSRLGHGRAHWRPVGIFVAALIGCGALAACTEAPQHAHRGQEKSATAAPEQNDDVIAEATPPRKQSARPSPVPRNEGAVPAPAAPPPPAPITEYREERSGRAAAPVPKAEMELPPAGGGAPVPSSLPPAASIGAAGGAATAESKTYDVVPVFYGTDRAVEADPKRLQFGSERGHKLQLGRALVTVPLIHKVPHIERPWVIEIPYFKVKVYEEAEDPAKHFTLQEIASLTEEQMLALVKERLAKATAYKDHAFVFVHGFNTSFDSALYRTAQIAYDLKFDGAPFLYSWPSGGKVASYTYDRGSVEQAEPSLAEFLKLVIQKSGAKSISLIAHSMGNELLLRVLERLRPEVPKGVVISQVILAAPDVDRDKFNIIAREITSFAKGVTLYAASNDRALGYSARFWGGVPRAGDVPKSGPLIIPGVDTIDVTAVSTDALGLNHSGYAENPTLLDDVKALVEFGIRPPDKRIKNVLTVQSENGTFWRFQPEK
ncbi:hypothetical protein DLM45_11710 [Hyphomicrobium methylovorum]|uniref:alpha/beta hydrolase n=1 Tax=Hyphomicrobium methylovorum TaxID=84 RepID=UPI0015E6835B|nr:alpha/beta hydrolase [Hyphomicrobium methylovorum]MBA2126879.1 hypothetical protein [Hyphomicrobium methylovorum]